MKKKILRIALLILMDYVKLALDSHIKPVVIKPNVLLLILSIAQRILMGNVQLTLIMMLQLVLDNFFSKRIAYYKIKLKVKPNFKRTKQRICQK